MSMVIIDKLRCINKGCPVSQETAEDIRRLRAQLAAAEARAERLSAAALDVIEFNRQHAHDQYGDADKCETWACVRTLRAALAEGEARDE